MDQEYPLVSALMLVRAADRQNIARAINCFESQTYPYKELIIINNCDSQLQCSELEIAARPNVFLVDTPSKLTAGMARNYGLSSCNGQIIAQFDCDSYHHPERLLKQAIALFQNDAQVCMLSQALKFSFISNHASKWSNDRNAILNSMMFIRPKGIDYLNLDKLEELSILEKLVANKYNAISLPMPYLMVKLIGDSYPTLIRSHSDIDQSDINTISDILLSIS